MVAKITAGKSIRGMLHYNENKVAEGEASLILASGFAMEKDQMSFNQKLSRFNHLLQLKPNVKTNAVHISLNFHSSEKLNDDRLQQIAARYMDRIGFGDQPFLVYRHDDAAHLHLHIVTINITAEAKRIDLHNNALTSEAARKAIEEEYKLIKAESKGVKHEAAIKTVDPKKIKYGRMPTKKAINNVVTAVTREYQFTSLAEYNAVLRCFNVIALRGAEHTPMYQNKGLLFSVLDAKGNPVGVPVKASAFYSKPTLRNLEKKFVGNKEKRKRYKANLKRRIESIFSKYSSLNRSVFEQEAKLLEIDVDFRANEQGLIFGVTFIDHQNKVVFNGSDLTVYSAKALLRRFNEKVKPVLAEKRPPLRPAIRRMPEMQTPTAAYLKPTESTNYLEILLEKTQPEYGTGVPRKRKKRKKKVQQITL